MTTFAGGAIGISTSYALVWLLSPRPFLAELLDDASGVTDIHLVVVTRPRAGERVDPDDGGLHRRPAAGGQGLASRPHRGAALRIAKARERLLQPVRESHRTPRDSRSVCAASEYSSTSPVTAGTSRWLTPGTLTTSTGAARFLRFCELLQPVRVGRRHLRIEQALHDENRLSDVRHRPGRIERRGSSGTRGCRPAAAGPAESSPSLCRSAPPSECAAAAQSWTASRPPSVSTATRAWFTWAMFSSAPVMPIVATSTSAAIRFSFARPACRPPHLRCDPRRRVACDRRPCDRSSSVTTARKSSA